MAWLYGIARYKLIDHHRRAGRRVTVPLGDVPEDILADEGSGHPLAGVDIERLLALLPRKQAAAIRLTRLQGLAVREAAAAFLPFAALSPLCGAMAFEFDGVFIGATWTRDMRDLMLASLAVYLALFFALRPFGNAGLWTALLGFLLARGGLQGWRYRALADATFPRSAEPAPSAGRW